MLEENITDMVGGSPALHDTIVTVQAAVTDSEDRDE